MSNEELEILKEKLLYPKGVLVLLKDTNLFNEALDKAIEEIESTVNILNVQLDKPISANS